MSRFFLFTFSPLASPCSKRRKLFFFICQSHFFYRSHFSVYVSFSQSVFPLLSAAVLDEIANKRFLLLFYCVVFFLPFCSLHPTCVCFFTSLMRGNCLEIKINNFLSVQHIIYLSLLKTHLCCVWGEWSLKLLFCVCNVLLNKKHIMYSQKTEDFPLAPYTGTLSSALNWKILKNPRIMKNTNLWSHKNLQETFSVKVLRWNIGENLLSHLKFFQDINFSSREVLRWVETSCLSSSVRRTCMQSIELETNIFNWRRRSSWNGGRNSFQFSAPLYHVCMCLLCKE